MTTRRRRNDRMPTSQRLRAGIATLAHRRWNIHTPALQHLRAGDSTPLAGVATFASRVATFVRQSHNV